METTKKRGSDLASKCRSIGCTPGSLIFTGVVLLIVGSIVLTFGIVLLVMPSFGDNTQTNEGNSAPVRRSTNFDTDDAIPCGGPCVCSAGGIYPYGRWCGLGHTGCIDDQPCDEIDACCKAHDECVTTYGKSSCLCSLEITRCVACANTSGSWCQQAKRAARNVGGDILYTTSGCFDGTR